MTGPSPFGEPGVSAERALLDRRIVLLSGKIDSARASEAAATVMTLDALGDDPVELRLNAESDSLDVAFTLMDTIEVLGVQVNATVASTVGGTIAGVLAVCTNRRIGALGRIHLREPTADFSGAATDLHRRATGLETQVRSYLRRLAEATGQAFEHVEADLRLGRHLTAESALGYGIVDEIVRP
ncbi:MAG TPA: ATP-dependent Clp protease proteolytic subunit [Acidimicrobiales bacterium]|nr:ATP-dependent Clp protease proteolytic subunit [Acidimicrobiales bacterium]